MCSPLTLFAVLAVVRQAIDSFRTERTASEILDVLGGFREQWDAFSVKMDALGRNLTTTTRASTSSPACGPGGSSASWTASTTCRATAGSM